MIPKTISKSMNAPASDASYIYNHCQLVINQPTSGSVFLLRLAMHTTVSHCTFATHIFAMGHDWHSFIRDCSMPSSSFFGSRLVQSPIRVCSGRPRDVTGQPTLARRDHLYKCLGHNIFEKKNIKYAIIRKSVYPNIRLPPCHENQHNKPYI